MIGFQIGDHKKKLDELKKAKCNTFQAFIQHKEIIEENLNSEQYKFNIVGHSSFSINLAFPFDYKSFIINKCIKEIKYFMNMNAICYVVHTGKLSKKIEQSRQEAMTNMINSLCYISNKLNLHKNNNFYLCLELLSGEKNDLINNIHELNNFMKIISKYKTLSNLKICLDTCHLFVSGYNIANKNIFDKYINDFNNLIGLNKIGLVHLNDSFYDCNSKKDKHEHINKGKIGQNIGYIYNIFSKLNIPIIIEMKNKYKENIQELQKLQKLQNNKNYKNKKRIAKA